MGIKVRTVRQYGTGQDALEQREVNKGKDAGVEGPRESDQGAVDAVKGFFTRNEGYDDTRVGSPFGWAAPTPFGTGNQIVGGRQDERTFGIFGGTPEPPPTAPGSGGAAGERDYVADRYGFQGFDPSIDPTGAIGALWNSFNSNMITSKAMADQMIADAVDATQQPYDEQLARLGRSIEDTRGKMNDLEKITDYYQNSTVAIWESAAQKARDVDGDEVRAATMERAAQVGKSFDVANENVQSYLDRIGGVPLSQRLVIEDTIRELQHPYEGLAEADISSLVKVTDAQGNYLEKMAYKGLADAQFEAEANQFAVDGILDRKLGDLEWEEDTTLANRTRAVTRAKRQANAEYAYTERMPEKGQFEQMAIDAFFRDKGIAPIDQDKYRGYLYEAMAGNMFSKPVVDRNGDPVMVEAQDAEGNVIMVQATEAWEIRTADDLEKAFMELDFEDQALIGDDEMQVLFDMFDIYTHAGDSWDAKNTSFKTQKRGGQAPDNKKNWAEQTPSYVQRAAYVKEIQGQLPTMFPGMISSIGGGIRTGPAGAGQAENSDHYSGGGLDIFPNSVADGNAIRAQLETWDNVSFTVYRENEAHMDHIHVSFLLPDQIISGNTNAVVPDTGYLTQPEPEPTTPSPTVSPSPAVRDVFSRYIGGGRTAN